MWECSTVQAWADCLLPITCDRSLESHRFKMLSRGSHLYKHCLSPLQGPFNRRKSQLVYSSCLHLVLKCVWTLMLRIMVHIDQSRSSFPSKWVSGESSSHWDVGVSQRYLSMLSLCFTPSPSLSFLVLTLPLSPFLASFEDMKMLSSKSYVIWFRKGQCF